MAGMSLAQASDELARLCPVMAELRRQVGPPRYPAVASDRRFHALVRMIVYQQLAGSAASAIFSRVETTLAHQIDPQSIISHPAASLKRCGLSEAKLRSIRDLAEKTANGTVAFAALARRNDQAVIDELTQVRGIGEWTAQMFLMFVLRRRDVWPVLDLGVRNGYGLAYALQTSPTARDLVALGDRFRPYRSVAAWYLWRAVDRARAAKKNAQSQTK